MTQTLSWVLRHAALAAGAAAAIACSADVVGPGKGSDADCYDACVAKGSKPEECSAFCSKSADSCYEGCVAKGVPPAECTAVCSLLGSGGKTPGTGGTAGSGASGATGGAGTIPGLDPDQEKTCIQCWYDATQTGGICADEGMACEYDLACTQLQWCPLICGKAECWAECNAIIPTGVAPLTALVQCVACGSGPCSEPCQGSVMLNYCN